MSRTEIINLIAVAATGIAAIAALLTALFVGRQTRSLEQQLKVYLSATRPFLLIRPYIEGQLTKLGYTAVNSGNIPARFVYETKQVWVGGNLVPELRKTNIQSIVHPGDPITISTTTLSDEDSKSIRNGKLHLEIAACAIYQSVSAGDMRRWQAISRHVFNPNKGAFDIVLLDDKEVPPSTERCQVEPTPGSG